MTGTPPEKDSSRLGKNRNTLAGATSRGECFTIMPFGTWSDLYYQRVFRPAIRRAGLISRRVDDVFRPTAIVQDVWAFTRRCALVLADLTDKNPNVFYELGLAHAIGKPAILVAPSMAEVPSDLRALRVLLYDKNDPKWGQVLGEKIVAAIEEVLNDSSKIPFLEQDLQSKHQDSERIAELQRELELAHQLLQQSIAVKGNYPPSEDEAIYSIKRDLRSGVADHVIIDRLTTRGMPRSWIIARIAQIRAET